VAERRGDLVKSPMVGTVYLQPQPGAPAFVKVGDKVNAGQTLMIIEAMKTMNPVPAPRARCAIARPPAAHCWRAQQSATISRQ
jgi:biotin carboxyl carrier protein